MACYSIHRKVTCVRLVVSWTCCPPQGFVRAGTLRTSGPQAPDFPAAGRGAHERRESCTMCPLVPGPGPYLAWSYFSFKCSEHPINSG